MLGIKSMHFFFTNVDLDSFNRRSTYWIISVDFMPVPYPPVPWSVKVPSEAISDPRTVKAECW